ncbi:ribosome maturation factor RimM [Parageobacillus thermoglucosidasius]|uniref:Ribosome maturation factor RimM n=3 Tax=Anoxybacillaceae TaxID=3120669 RepID=A0AB38R4F9_PARTM|nr:ribosome maturation factor RimM [Parageobacillus thermoglucosidasius]AEH48610.1 16S rRNA processing protein RimM [Parageobacillus thermoglucosidasius C56-YS93]ALF10130.1 16S rRNA processing protein RimM [Parageobacillus thermoglucosidasius]ANZ30212.1 ribosome maturation factor RimM [Parageobacillus thermoglucosidasius]APM80949.1 ribosome maturation factor RimM [Parageobacillus thermoglucosidasius]KJX70665.1 16S rRNA processing protein RimM [Parageobacillus thermoglucosidasius]
MEKWFNVGKIVNTHGIRGEVRVISRTDFPEERYKKGNTLYIFMEKSQEPIEVIVKSHRVHKSFDLLSFEGYDNINLVEKFKGAMLKVPESQLGELNEGEYYFHEIIGCTVVTEEGETVGTVSEILTPGANDVWVVKRNNGKEALIPYIEDIVKNVDVEAKIITIRPMEGLLE